MSAYIQLTLAQLRLFARNRQMLFWTLLFPILLMIMLGSFLGNGNAPSLSALVIDQEQSVQSQALITAIQDTKFIKVTQNTEVSSALSELKRGNQQLVVIIPKGYEAALAAKSSASTGTKVKVYYDETNATTIQQGLPIFNQVIDGISKKLTNYVPIISVDAEGVQSLNLKYIDFLVPGIVGMMIMSNNLNGVAGQIASWRERGILRRMQSTPLNASSFIAAQITARLLLNGLQAVIVLLVGSLALGAQVNGSWPLLLGFVVLGTLAFMSIGFIIAGLAKTPESAGPIAGVISFPMLFLGGVFFPINSMPDFLQPIVKLFPISHLTLALRQVMNVGADLTTLWSEAAILGGWVIVAFVISTFTFKWE